MVASTQALLRRTWYPARPMRPHPCIWYSERSEKGDIDMISQTKPHNYANFSSHTSSSASASLHIIGSVEERHLASVQLIDAKSCFRWIRLRSRPDKHSSPWSASPSPAPGAPPVPRYVWSHTHLCSKRAVQCSLVQKAATHLRVRKTLKLLELLQALEEPQRPICVIGMKFVLPDPDTRKEPIWVQSMFF